MTPRRTWEEGLSFFRRFREEHGDSAVPKNFTFDDDEFNLDVWVQNTGARADRLTTEQVNALDRLNFPWPQSHDENWKRRIDEFKRAVAENGGDTDIKSRFVLSTGERVGAWCARIRNYRSRAKLSDSRIRELDGLDFHWRDSIREEQITIERRRLRDQDRERRLAQIKSNVASL